MSSKDRPQGQDAYLRIVDEIRAGLLHPGDRVTETELAQRFGISRTPIREAIRQLESDGLVVHTPRVGATIRTLDHAEVSELYDMRTVLEGAAARFAARAASEVELHNLETIHLEMLGTSDAAELSELNRQFHLALLDAARNRFLVKAVAAINTTLLILGPTTLEENDRAAHANEEHAAILKALQARDEQAAEAAMVTHIAAAHRARLRQFRTTAHVVGGNYDI
ncbi:MAG: GntR family transcriptional regulator [Thalassovita sp.]|nr:GntR family transcriptional regulator [Thalassovita sp.]